MVGVLHTNVGWGRPNASHVNTTLSVSLTVKLVGENLRSTGTKTRQTLSMHDIYCACVILTHS